jgi:thiamine-monophosphate kinase
LIIDITATGSIKRRQALRRSGARPGDLVYVTGWLGAAGAGLEMLGAGAPAPDADCVRHYLYPEPRVRTGLLLARNRAASACMDLSDGLADGVRQIAAASGVGIVVDAAALPILETARDWFQANGQDPVNRAVGAGDDYELVFTIPSKRAGRIRAAERLGGTPITRIGVCTATRDVVLKRESGEAVMSCGYSHFRMY